MKRSNALKSAQDRYLSGKPKPISFRLDGEPRTRLQAHQRDGESENQTAKRLLLAALEKI